MRRLRRALFWLSRTRPMGVVVRLAFGRLWWLLPVRRVAQTRGVLAFEHPAPSWQPHILLVPKRAVRSLLAAGTADVTLVGEIVRLALAVAARRDLYRQGFALLVNGGTYQDVPQLHFHLAGLDDGLRYTLPAGAPDGPILAQSARLVAYQHPQPQRAIHIVVVRRERLAWRDLAGPAGEQIGQELVPLAQRLVRQHGLGAAGFTLLASIPPGELEGPGGLDGSVSFHLVGGGRAEAASC